MTDLGGIIDVLGRYAVCWDGRDLDGFMSSFGDDAVLELPGTADSRRSVRGDAELRAFATQRWNDLGTTSTRHILGIPVVRCTGARATAQTPLVVVHTPAGDPLPRLHMSGVYRDHLLDTPAGWRLTHRVIERDATDPSTATVRQED